MPISDRSASEQRSWPCVCLGDARDLEVRPVSGFSRALPADYLFRQQIRKWWEWEYIAGSAEELGAAHSGAVAIGLGTGFEPLMFHFTNACKKVIATDLYSDETSWSEARFSDPEAVRKIAPMDYPVDRLSIENADMRHLPVGDASVDLVWSTSSIEHVPSLVDEIGVFREIARVLKPGGVAVLTTEYCISEPPYLLPGVQAMDAALFRAITDQATCFDVVGAWDLSYNWKHPANGVHVRRFIPPYFSPLLKIGGPRLAALKAGQMANAVGLSLIAPIAFVLRRRPTGALPDWDKIELPPVYRVMSDGAHHFSQGRNAEASSTLRRLWEGQPEVGLQTRLHAARFGFDAELRNGRQQGSVADMIRRFLADLPRHALQDADCSDLFSYVLLESGDAEAAADICLEAACSPSTISDQAIRLAVRHAIARDRLGARQDGARFVGDIVADVVVSGVPGDGSASALANALRDERASAEVAAAVADAVQERLVEVASKVDVECSALSDGLSALRGGTRRGTKADAESRQYVRFGGDRRPGLRAQDRTVPRARPLSRISGVLQVLRRGRISGLTVAEPGADTPPPVLETPVSQACTQAQLDAAVYRTWCGAIREVPRYHRKQWEFCYILQALSVAGMLEQGCRGLGFGVGIEPLTAVFAARGCRVVATDLHPDEAQTAGWVATNQHALNLAALNDRGICEPDRFVQNVSFRFVDMNEIPSDLLDFDFTWSACSLEHLGSIAQGLEFIENSLKTLRPGGIAVHTTEFNCSSDKDTIASGGTVLFRKRDFLALAARLAQAGHKLEFNFNLGEQPLDRHIDVAPYSSDRHLKLQIAQYATTSFGLIIRKAS